MLYCTQQDQNFFIAIWIDCEFDVQCIDLLSLIDLADDCKEFASNLYRPLSHAHNVRSKSCRFSGVFMERENFTPTSVLGPVSFQGVC